MNDLHKALCYLTGNQYDAENTLQKLFDGVSYKDNTKIYDYKEWGVWYDWSFFKVKVFKKSTMHVQFKDDKVWELFNRAVAKAKGYPLPESKKL